MITKLKDEMSRKQMAELKNHPHTKLIETCSPSEFEPQSAAGRVLARGNSSCSREGKVVDP
jgi:hypothetical protein